MVDKHIFVIYNLDMNDLENLKGLSKKTITELKNLEIYSINDLIEHYPYKYNLLKLNNIDEIEDGENILIEGILASPPLLRRINPRLNILLFKVNTNRKLINIIIYNRAYIKKNLLLGKEITIFGKWDEKRNTITATNILFSKIINNTYESIYHLTNGISNKTMTKIINNALLLKPSLNDYVPEYLNEKYNFISKNEAIRKIHNPKNEKDIKQAKLKLIYEELFKLMFKMNYLKLKIKTNNNKPKKIVQKSLIDDFIRTLPFELTKDQLNAVKGIYEDLSSNHRMNRLLQGDVGSGKTIVGIIAAYITYLSGGQSALMAPTEILANQHFQNVKNILIETNMRIELLTGNTKKKERDIIIDKLEKGQIDLVIGTHALLNEKLKFKNLSLVITDEQHRFGVNQRTLLNKKGENTDILYMSATPIPRTYALTLYGDMDITNIKTKPKGRKEIKTIIKEEKEIKDVLYLMLEEIKKGRQIYVVSPLIEENENLDLKTVIELKEKIDIAFNNKVKTEILHGKLNKKDKDEIMKNFINGETKILISTTVIEVGVDVTNATMIVVFNADRFGLATLHQLRGRIGRNEYDSTCILIGPKNNERLKVLNESNDGFYITEKDFEMRKEGDLFGIKQSGEMFFKIADLKRDYKILMQTKIDSEEFLKENITNDFKNYPIYYKIVKEIEKLN